MNISVTGKKSSVFGGEPGGEAVDAVFVLFSTIFILTMQTGFGLLESGEI